MTPRDEVIARSLRLSMFAWFGYELPLPERLALIRDAGFTGTFLWWGDEESSVRGGHGARMFAQVAEAGLILDNVHLPFKGTNDLWSDRATVRRARLDDTRRWMEELAPHGVPILVVHPTQGSTPPAVNTHGLHGFETMVEHARSLGLYLALENTRSGTHLDAILEAVDDPHLGLCWDSGHENIWGDGSTLGRWGHRLLTTHLADNRGVEDDHLVPHEGSVPWKDLLANFPCDTYKGNLGLEVVPDGSYPRPAAADFVRTARAGLLRIENALAARASRPDRT